MTVSDILGKNGGLDITLPKFLEVAEIKRVLQDTCLNAIQKGLRDEEVVFDDQKVIEILEAMPPADVVPGQCYRKLRPAASIDWLPKSRGGLVWAYACSGCGHLDTDVFSKGRFRFCPMCGGVYNPEEVAHETGE